MSRGYWIWLIISVTAIAYGFYGPVSGEILKTVKPHPLTLVLRTEDPLVYWISILGYLSGGSVSGLILMKNLASDKKIKEYRKNNEKRRRQGKGWP